MIVALASFATFVLVDPENNILDASTAFVSLTLFNLLRVPLNVLPILIVYLIQCQVSLKRINKFINSEELDPEAVSHQPQVEAMVKASEASFAWDKAYIQPTLSHIQMEVLPGQLVAVVGPVGSGKSSLLSAMLGEMVRLQGQINTRGREKLFCEWHSHEPYSTCHNWHSRTFGPLPKVGKHILITI